MGSLVCRIELNKADGITITVDNASEKITQTVVMNGTSIVTKCKGSSNTSTITQDQKTISIECTEFKLKADTISCESTKNTTHKSGKNFDVTASSKATLKSTGNMTVQSNTGNVTVKANTGSLSAQGTSGATVKSNATALFQGMSTTVKGMSTTIKGATGTVMVN